MAPTSHARRAPSAASRWLRCPGSVNFIDDLERDGDVDEPGHPAAHGTILHSFCEDALSDHRDAYYYVGERRECDGYTLELTDDLADMMQAGLDYIDEVPGRLHIEHEVNLERWMPEDFGTLDVGIVGKKLITIFDWKWGFLPVSAIENEQLMIYALGFWDNIARHISDATRFRLVIWQPRAPGGGGEWETTLEELLEFGRRVKMKAAETVAEDAPRQPGPVQCKYCPGARQRKCPEYDAYNLSLIIQDFDDMDDRMGIDVGPRLPKASQLTPERRTYILQHRSMFDQWFERLHADALDDALKGRPVPGMKAVYGRRPARKYKDEDPDKGAPGEFLRRALGDDAYVRKLLSPAQAEAELPDAIFAKMAEMIDQGRAKPILVSVKDARPAVTTVEELFDEDEPDERGIRRVDAGPD